MARTKASIGAKVSSVKSSKARAAAAPPPPTKSGGKSSRANPLAGGNPVCPRETPAWQKPITCFFNTPSDKLPPPTVAGPSKPRKINVIESDSEDEQNSSVLDTSVDLQPLDGEACHKIAEYFPKVSNSQQDDKENQEPMVEMKSTDDSIITTGKRSLDEAEVSISKKIKV